MDEKRKKEIDAAWRKARREQFLEDMRHVKFGWLLILIAAAALIVSVAAVASVRPTLIETVEGRIVGKFSVPSKYWPGRWRVAVQLHGGGTAQIKMPKGEVLRTDADMKLRHTRRVLGPLTYDDYRFAGYVDGG
jgi:hypothetical protein